MSETAAHPSWEKPVATGSVDTSSGIFINNTLTGSMDEFVSSTPGHITWYTCGPTVYDSAHVGHARAYVTFDLIRRVLGDYFGYSIFYVMNVTDIDDKIILRARRDYLWLQFVKVHSPTADDLMSRGMKALGSRKDKLLHTLSELDAQCGTADKRTLKGVTEQIAATKLKLKNQIEALSELSDSVPPTDERLEHLVKDAISEELDFQSGASITDHSIFAAHASRFEEEFLEDMERLGVRPADVYTRVSEYVPQIVEYVEKIISNGFAYVCDNSVYFDTAAFDAHPSHDYAKLVPTAKGDLTLIAEGEGALGDKPASKKSNCDFALWKASKPGEPSWDSPWGPGRPGWHIECSAMASDILGSNFDIHSGGIDLAFPHHDNELAQAEAHFDCKQWVNYFMHAGHLHIDGLKMSKSLKNFITIRQALEHFTPAQLRIVFLLQGWDRTMNFSDQFVDEAITKEKKLKEFFLEVEVHLRKGTAGKQVWNTTDRVLHEDLLASQSLVDSALKNNFDFPTAFQALFNLVSKVNVYMSSHPALRTPLLRKCAMYVHKMLTIFGVVNSDSLKMTTSSSQCSDTQNTLSPVLDCLVEFRKQIRTLAIAEGNHDILKLCDQFRDQSLPPLGIRLDDSQLETVWKLVDPAEYMEEIKAQEDARSAKELSKKKSRVKILEKLIASATQSSVEPKSLFLSHSDSFSAFDSDGFPTHDAEGEQLAKKKIKKLRSQLAKHEKDYMKLQACLASDPDYVGSLRAEHSQLSAELSE